MTSFDITPAVERALQIARHWAWSQESSEYQTGHLLQGLLHEEEGRPWQMLSDAGLDPHRVRKKLPAAPGEVSHEHSPSELVQQVLDRAYDLSCSFGEEHCVSSEHLLVALLEADLKLRRKLEDEGLQFDQLYSIVVRTEGPPIQLDEPLHLDQSADISTAARIVDASANRAREALRVMEDYCRFALNDAYLTSELKRVRHALADALRTLPADALLDARDTEGDVGASITVNSEMDRGQLSDVLLAGSKRLQEALRSLEEYGKLFSMEFARRAESLRYRAYVLEKALLSAPSARGKIATMELCVLVSTHLCRSALTDTIREAAEGGAAMIQLREKNLDDRTLLALAREACDVAHKAGAFFILNDRPDLARLAGADGVHLGQGDLGVQDARRILGPEALIGVSTHNLEQLQQAAHEGASYVGIGPVFPSSTKRFPEFAGLDFIRDAVAETSLPAFAIGGITLENLPDVTAAGARRVAVSAAVCQAHDPAAAASALLRHLRRV